MLTHHGVVCDMMWCVLCGVVWCGSWVQWVKKIRSDYRLVPYLSYSLLWPSNRYINCSLNKALDGSIRLQNVLKFREGRVFWSIYLLIFLGIIPMSDLISHWCLLYLEVDSIYQSSWLWHKSLFANYRTLYKHLWRMFRFSVSSKKNLTV